MPRANKIKDQDVHQFQWKDTGSVTVFIEGTWKQGGDIVAARPVDSEIEPWEATNERVAEVHKKVEPGSQSKAAGK